jgi:hypothetical protein
MQGHAGRHFYNDLPPGSYHFRVTGSNNDGLWNEAGASLSFSIAPAWYQTLWFRLLCAVLFLASLSLFYRLRVRQIAAEMNTRFDERLAERTRLARDFMTLCFRPYKEARWWRTTRWTAMLIRSVCGALSADCQPGWDARWMKAGPRSALFETPQ